MKLENKKQLVARTLGIGKARIRFNTARLNEVKEAITKQDVRELLSSGAITVLPIRGRRALISGKKRRTPGKVRMTVVDTKRNYITLTRKFRNYLFALRKAGKVSEESYMKLRREIRASIFKNLTHFKERVSQLQ